MREDGREQRRNGRREGNNIVGEGRERHSGRREGNDINNHEAWCFLGRGLCSIVGGLRLSNNQTLDQDDNDLSEADTVSRLPLQFACLC